MYVDFEQFRYILSGQFYLYFYLIKYVRLFQILVALNPLNICLDWPKTLYYLILPAILSFLMNETSNFFKKIIIEFFL